MVSGPLFFPSTPASTPSSSSGAASAEGALTVDGAAAAVQPGPDTLQIDPVALCAMNETEIGQQVLEMLACLKRQSAAEVASGVAHTDGTLAIGSMVAVWVLVTVGKAFGRRLVRLSDVDPDALRSVGGVAKLIKEATAGTAVAGAAGAA